jgi:hypothetical protein
LSDLRASGGLSPEFEMWRTEVLNLIEATREPHFVFTNSHRQELRDTIRGMVEQLFADVRKEVPMGAYFKNFGEFGTGDLGNQITTFSSSYKEIADEFLRQFETLLGLRGKEAWTEMQKQEFSDFGSNGLRFVRDLITSKPDLLVQERVMIAKSELGAPMEFRVDFLQGQPVVVRPRFGSEYQPEGMEKAGKLVEDFFKNAPDRVKVLSGGADVAQLSDGRWVLIEFNFGSESGTLYPGYYPIEYHLYISRLSGKRTEFLSGLDKLVASPIDQQNRYLRSLKHERAVWERTGFEDLSVEDIGKFFRDELLEGWRRRGAPAEEAAGLHKQIDQLFAGFESDAVKKVRDSGHAGIRRLSR